MKLTFFEEPELEFGGGGTHVDMRYGLAQYGPLDIGDTKDIHPRNKQDVGKRLALAAEKMVYGKTDVESSGPMYASHVVEGDKIRVKFAHADGLVARGGTPGSFAIAGEDKKFHWADAAIEAEAPAGDAIARAGESALQAERGPVGGEEAGDHHERLAPGGPARLEPPETAVEARQQGRPLADQHPGGRTAMVRGVRDTRHRPSALEAAPAGGPARPPSGGSRAGGRGFAGLPAPYC